MAPFTLIWTNLVTRTLFFTSREKFRIQTSGKMDSSRGGKSQNREEKKKGQKKEDLGARIGRKVAKRYVFPLPVAPEGQKVGSLKRRVRSHLGSWEIKNCTPLWGEARLKKSKR